MRISIFHIFTVKIYFSLKWNIFSIFSLVSYQTTFVLSSNIQINLNHHNNYQFLITSELFKMTESIYWTENSRFFYIKQDLFSCCGMKVIIFHYYVAMSPLLKHLFSYHSMKIKPVFIEKTWISSIYIFNSYLSNGS